MSGISLAEKCYSSGREPAAPESSLRYGFPRPVCVADCTAPKYSLEPKAFFLVKIDPSAATFSPITSACWQSPRHEPRAENGSW